ncbi:hypothetical protein SAY86_010738 [Trapa natans]|uniref:Ubiquitin-like protease family profile domain-containing protein n=1 Tax=Trapa natans TaxID=22666 RepID=A0AAN7R3J8_TRANT|nr:hypothetical protein SAY86_010738 [Trapa natans]
MGALTSSRKRNEECLNSGCRQPRMCSPEFQSSKRVKFSRGAPEWSSSSWSIISRISWYPKAASSLHREVHAPVRSRKFGFFASFDQFKGTTSTTRGIRGEERSGSKIGYIVGHMLGKKPEKLDGSTLADDEPQKVVVMSEDSTVEAIEDQEPQKQVSGRSLRQVIDLVDDEPPKALVASDDSSSEEIGIVGVSKSANVVGANLQESVVTELSHGLRGMVDKMEEVLVPTSLDRGGDDSEILSKQAYQKLLEESHRRHDPKLTELEFQIKHNLEKLSLLHLERIPEKPEEEVPNEPFAPLTEEEESQVQQALSGNRRKVLAAHRDSGIKITGEILQCLRPTAWLNDEVINLYLELLKEREKREPEKFLKCHFFSTFFYNKLTSKDGYDYKSVRRWTTRKKLGYGLIDCDKIFMPIHQKVHWCLAIINMKEQKFQYLDSLGGRNSYVLKILANYIVDEVKDKNGEDLDVRSWDIEYVEDLPKQENSYDCGMFMIKYADFYSRGLGLCFNQEHMPYFRRRTAKEILKLWAD